jgi:hypothetical protein
MLLTACLSDNVLVPSGSLKSKLEPLGLLPLKRKDIVDILTNPFIEKHSTLTGFAKDEMNLSMNEIEDILQEVALKSLRVGSKVSIWLWIWRAIILMPWDTGENTQEACWALSLFSGSFARECGSAIYYQSG